MLGALVLLALGFSLGLYVWAINLPPHTPNERDVVFVVAFGLQCWILGVLSAKGKRSDE